MRLLTVLAVVAWSAVASGEEILLDRIVAVVDGVPVMHSVVKTKVDQGPLVVVSDFPAEEKDTAFVRGLQDAINFELVMKKVREMEIEVPDEQLDAQINAHIERQGLDRERVMQLLAQEGQTWESYRKSFREQMILQRFQGRVIAPLVKVTDKDIETYFLKAAGSTADLVQLTLRPLLIGLPRGATSDVVEAKRKLAEEVYQKLKGGMAFKEAARIYSDDPSARTDEGFVQKIRLRELATSFQAQIEPLEVGQFSPPIATEMGFFLFLLEDKNFSGSDEFERKRKSLEYELRNMELTAQTRRWLAEQRQRSKVEIID